jgi:predicted short-subunit dehydrogenase-like oxidoreductase (DUF2520 family)
MKKKTQSLTVIGAGKLAWSLTPALIKAGYNISCIISRKYVNALELASRYKIRSISDNVKDSRYSDIILLCIPDDKLSFIAGILAGADIKGKTFVHFSGVLSSSILDVLRKKGAHTASFHMMQTFPSKKKVDLKGTYTAIESSDQETSGRLFKLAEDLGLNPVSIDPMKKTEYHLAGVYASNFLVSNVFAAERFFNSTQNSIDFIPFIEPILKRTISNIKKAGVVNSLSGPVERGDYNTVKLHLKTLQKNKLLMSNYICQSLLILDIKKEQEKLSPAHKKIEKILSGQLRKIHPGKSSNNK